MPIVNVPVGGQARSIHVQQIINWLRGLPSYTEPVSFTGLDSTSYALTVANNDGNSTNFGRALIVKNSTSTVNLLDVQNSGVTVKPHSASQSVFRVRNFADTENLFEVSTSGVNVGSENLATDVNTLTLTNKTLDGAILTGNRVSNWLDVTQDVAPANPASNRLRLYAITGTDFIKVRTNAGVISTLVDVENAQTLLNKTLSGGTVIGITSTTFQEWIHQASDPAAPAAGGRRIYTHADGLKMIDSTSVVKTFATLEGTETLLAKSLTTPNLTGPVITNYIAMTRVATPGDPVPGRGYLWLNDGMPVLRYKAGDSTVREVVDLDSIQTLTNKTFTITSLTGTTLISPLVSNYAGFTHASNPGGTAGVSRLWADTSNMYFTLPSGVATTILTSSNTSIASSLSFARSLSLGGL